MRIQVQKIVPSPLPEFHPLESEWEVAAFKVCISIGQREDQFRLVVEAERLGERQLQVIRGDADFEKIFKENLQLHREICQLVSQVYNHQLVELPVDLGEFEGEPLQAVKVLPTA